MQTINHQTSINQTRSLPLLYRSAGQSFGPTSPLSGRKKRGVRVLRAGGRADGGRFACGSCRCDRGGLAGASEARTNCAGWGLEHLVDLRGSWRGVKPGRGGMGALARGGRQRQPNCFGRADGVPIAATLMVEGSVGLAGDCAEREPADLRTVEKKVWYGRTGCRLRCFRARSRTDCGGPTFGAAWVDELAAFRNFKETWEQSAIWLAVGQASAAGYHDDAAAGQIFARALEARGEDVVVTKGSDVRESARIWRRRFSAKLSRRTRGRGLAAKNYSRNCLTDTPGALWSDDLLEENRRTKAEVPSNCRRVVVGVDPAMSDGQRRFGRVRPCRRGAWRRRSWLSAGRSFAAKCRRSIGRGEAIRLYHKWGADRIVAEIKSGRRRWSQQTLRTVDPNVELQGCSCAKRGKTLRAEPVAALYEQHRVITSARSRSLKINCAAYAAGSSSSPDRLDSLCSSRLSELMLGADATMV